MLKSEIMPQNLIIGFDAKRIVRNATGLGNYGRTLVNDLVAGSPDNWLFRLYAPDRGRDDLREGIIHSYFIVRLFRCQQRVKRLFRQIG